MYKFTYLLSSINAGLPAAMQASHACANDYFGFTMFLLLMALVNILGALCCIVGILVTIPISMAAITVAYQNWWLRPADARPNLMPVAGAGRRSSAWPCSGFPPPDLRLRISLAYRTPCPFCRLTHAVFASPKAAWG
jgi:hypothetical protein